MRSPHRLALAVILGGAALSGTVALSKTVQLGADTPKAKVDEKAIARRHAQLTAAERSAKKALAQETPPLPGVPKVGPVAVPNLGAVVMTRFVAAPVTTTGKTSRVKRTPAKKAVRRPAPTAGTPSGGRGDSEEAREREAEAAKKAAEQAREAAKQAAEAAAEAAKKAGGDD